MRVEVALLPSLLREPACARTAVLVVDVVRATSTLVTALASGASGVWAEPEVESARARAADLGALLAGERGGLPPQGFDHGNSPREMTPQAVGGRDLVLTTTNGTRAVQAGAGAGAVLAVALLNAELSCRAVAEGWALADGRPAERVVVVCAGSGGEVCADDVAAAGCLVGNLALLAGAEPDDPARAAVALFDAWRADVPGLLARSLSGRKLAEAGLAELDLPVCARVDAVATVAALDSGGVFRKLERPVGSAPTPPTSGPGSP